MLSARTLERVSVAYRRGYMDGHNLRPHTGALARPEYIKPFADFDYDEGYKAGANDRYWVDFYAQRNQPEAP